MNITSDFDTMVKLLVIGNSKVGKTKFIYRFIEDKFFSFPMVTMGIDKKAKNIQLNHKTIKIELWDSPGQSNFTTTTTSLFHKVDGIIMLYTINDDKSFESICNFIKVIREIAGNIPLCICGNKCDLDSERLVEEEKGKMLKDANNVIFYETSSKNNINVHKSIKELTNLVLNFENITQGGLSLNTNSSYEKRKQSC